MKKIRDVKQNFKNFVRRNSFKKPNYSFGRSPEKNLNENSFFIKKKFGDTIKPPHSLGTPMISVL